MHKYIYIKYFCCRTKERKKYLKMSRSLCGPTHYIYIYINIYIYIFINTYIYT